MTDYYDCYAPVRYNFQLYCYSTVIQLKNIRVEHAQYTRERMALYPCTVIPNRNQRIRDFVSAGLAT